MSLLEMTYDVLKENEKQEFTAKELAIKVVESFPAEFENKRKNKRFKTEEDFIRQVAAEIGSLKSQLLNKEGVIINRQSRPQKYLYDTEYEFETEPDEEALSSSLEEDLYPILGSFLRSELEIYSKRINEKESKNNKGLKGNIWLHPDLVGIKFLDKSWEPNVKKIVKSAGVKRVKLYSFEVKKEIRRSTLRENFFQAVSNSSWANQGYLVAGELKESKKDGLFSELEMLSSLHGIGFILLNKNNPSESQILLQAREKQEPDWVSINRLVKENPGFQKFIKSLKIYYESGEIVEQDWYQS